jgi:hypothetical protein
MSHYTEALRFAVAAKDADGEAQFRTNVERLGQVTRDATDEPVVVSKSDIPDEAQAEQPKKSWKQWLTGK